MKFYEFNLGIRFQNIVKKYPNHTAIKFSQNKDDFISYAELNAKSNQISRFLLNANLAENDVVCISSEKVIQTYACMLACLKIGISYSILDIKSPKKRLMKIVDKAKPKMLLLSNSLAKEIKGLCSSDGEQYFVKDFDYLESKSDKYSQNNLKNTRKIRGSIPAYIMFTSGSTGSPKGAVITHSNVLNFIYWGTQQYDITNDSVFSNFNPLYFDNSVFDFYLSLFNGSTLIPFTKNEILNPKRLVTKIDKFQCTILFSVPSMFIYMDTMKIFTNPLKSIKYIIFGGEGYPKIKLKSLFDKIGHRVNLYNVYGPTECTCICTSYKISENDFISLNDIAPLGRINDNFSFMILNNFKNKVDNGEIGELYLMGPNVGKGYYKDNDLTNNSFIQNPFNSSYPEIIYKTGDLVRLDIKDGKIYFHGRLDNQIKHMGYRIELEEIEFGLNSITYIYEAAVLYIRLKGVLKITAIISSKKKISDRDISEDLNLILPDYMIPSVYYFQSDLPKNRNGKLDRKKLLRKYESN